MSRFTDDLYRRWMVSNGSAGPRKRGSWGMGRRPMSAPRSEPVPLASSSEAAVVSSGVPARGALAANDESYSRLDKQDVLSEGDYVDNIKY